MSFKAPLGKRSARIVTSGGMIAVLPALGLELEAEGVEILLVSFL